MRRLLKRTVQLGFLAGIGYAVWRYFDRQREGSEVAWEPQPFPYPPQPRTETRTEAEATTAAPPVSDAPAPAPATAPTTAPAGKAWVEAAEGTCPATHPVKAKLSSKIFHVPGGANYDRTKADRCYADAAAAAADGLRKAAR